MKRHKKTTPLLSAIALSMLCSSLAAAVGAHSIYRNYNTDGWSQPAIAALMQGIANHDYPWSSTGNASGNANAPSHNQSGMEGQVNSAPDGSAGLADASPDGSAGLAATSPDGSSGQAGTSPDGSSGQAGTSPDGSAGLAATSPDGSAGPAGTAPSSPSEQADDTMQQAEPRQYEFTDVTREYFDDALLIGDSRAEGVALYSGWDNLTCYTEGGMTICNMFQRQADTEDGRKLTVEEALQAQSFGKIYLEIGINEMGTGTVDSFMEAYEGAVNRLRELQPDAILYLCGIMYVKQSKSESDPIFNNPNIQARNDRIAQLADRETIFYLDINELVTDETGNLNPDYTWDEVHLLGKYNSLWLDYFCSHGIVKDVPAAAANE